MSCDRKVSERWWMTKCESSEVNSIQKSSLARFAAIAIWCLKILTNKRTQKAMGKSLPEVTSSRLLGSSRMSAIPKRIMLAVSDKRGEWFGWGRFRADEVWWLEETQALATMRLPMSRLPILDPTVRCIATNAMHNAFDNNRDLNMPARSSSWILYVTCEDSRNRMFAASWSHLTPAPKILLPLPTAMQWPANRRLCRTFLFLSSLLDS